MGNNYLIAIGQRVQDKAFITNECLELDAESFYYFINSKGELEGRNLSELTYYFAREDRFCFQNAYISVKNIDSYSTILVFSIKNTKVIEFKNNILSLGDLDGKVKYNIDISKMKVSATYDKSKYLYKLADIPEKSMFFLDNMATEQIDTSKEPEKNEVELQEITPNKFIVDRYSKMVADYVAENTKEVTAKEREEEREKEAESKISQDIKGLENCPICHGTGIYYDEFGLPIICGCVSERNNRIAKIKAQTADFKDYVSKGDADRAVQFGLVPENKADITYNRDAVTMFSRKMWSVLGIAQRKDEFKNYLDTLDNIQFGLNNNKLPEISYIMYSPNGFGKETFAVSCIKQLFSHNRKCVPYISGIELAEKKRKFYAKLTGQTLTDDRYTWEDYVVADMVFLYVASMKDATLEFNTIGELLQLRSARNKPTLIFLFRPMNIYKANKDILHSFVYNFYTDNKDIASMSRCLEVSMRCGIIPDKNKGTIDE